MGWADDFRTLGVRANADTPEQAAQAVEFGAEGIGLCRTEHMFLGDRVPAVQDMILARRKKRARRRWPFCFRCSAATSWASSRP